MLSEVVTSTCANVDQYLILMLLIIMCNRTDFSILFVYLIIRPTDLRKSNRLLITF